MVELPVWLKKGAKNCTLSVFVQAGAKGSKIVGTHGVYLKIRIAAPRVEGKANESLIAYLADVLKLPKQEIRLVRGDFGKQKVIEVQNCPVGEILTRIRAEIASFQAEKE